MAELAYRSDGARRRTISSRAVWLTVLAIAATIFLWVASLIILEQLHDMKAERKVQRQLMRDIPVGSLLADAQQKLKPLSVERLEFRLDRPFDSRQHLNYLYGSIWPEGAKGPRIDVAIVHKDGVVTEVLARRRTLSAN